MNDIFDKNVSVGGGGIPYHEKTYALWIVEFHVIMHITKLWINFRK